MITVSAQAAGSQNMAGACYSDPSTASCATYLRPDADVLADLDLICGTNSSLSGCTLWGFCQNGTAGGPFCEPFSIVADLCGEANSTAGCEAYNALCRAGSKAPQCSCYPEVPNLLTSAEAKQAMMDLCGTHWMSECSQCGGEMDPTYTGPKPTPCSLPLNTVSKACQEMPDMGECQGFWDMCNQQSVYTAFPKLCSETGKVPAGWKAPDAPKCGVAAAPGPAPAAVVAAAPAPAPSPSSNSSSGMGSADGMAGGSSEGDTVWGTPSRNMTDPCYTDPTQASCAGFTRTDADTTDDIRKLCHDMPFMIGCTLYNTCQNSSTTKANGPYCQPFSILGDLCLDMPKMKGCEAYVALCNSSSSQVAQCKSPGPVPKVLTTFNARTQIQDMCASMGMDGCDECTGTSWTTCTDPLATIAKLCLGMPEMSGCADYQAMCSGDVEMGFPSVCTLEGQADASGSASIPPMKMYLHQAWSEIILTLHWIPRTKGAMVGAWFACFFAAIFVQALKTWRLLIEARWARQRAGACCSGGITALAGGPADAEAVFSSGPAAAVDITAGTCCGGGAAAAAGAGFAGAAAGNGSAGSLRGKGSSHGSSGELYGAGPHAGGQQPQGVAGRLQRWQRRALGGRPLMTRQQFYRNCVRSLFTTAIVFLDYMLMLIVMTFNVALIVFTCVGFGVGALLFGHAGEQPARSGSEEALLAADVERQYVENGGCCGGKHV
ncbi:hypothetical protein N2152v2_009964 [Parachlorella kessleri]